MLTPEKATLGKFANRMITGVSKIPTPQYDQPSDKSPFQCLTMKFDLLAGSCLESVATKSSFDKPVCLLSIKSSGVSSRISSSENWNATSGGGGGGGGGENNPGI